jgi:hypothetical protein
MEGVLKETRVPGCISKLPRLLFPFCLTSFSSLSPGPEAADEAEEIEVGGDGISSSFSSTEDVRDVKPATHCIELDAEPKSRPRRLLRLVGLPKGQGNAIDFFLAEGVVGLGGGVGRSAEHFEYFDVCVDGDVEVEGRVHIGSTATLLVRRRREVDVELEVGLEKWKLYLNSIVFLLPMVFESSDVFDTCVVSPSGAEEVKPPASKRLI